MGRPAATAGPALAGTGNPEPGTRKGRRRGGAGPRSSAGERSVVTRSPPREPGAASLRQSSPLSTAHVRRLRQRSPRAPAQAPGALPALRADAGRKRREGGPQRSEK